MLIQNGLNRNIDRTQYTIINKESSLFAKQKLAELSVMPINSQNTPPAAEVYNQKVLSSR